MTWKSWISVPSLALAVGLGAMNAAGAQELRSNASAPQIPGVLAGVNYQVLNMEQMVDVVGTQSPSVTSSVFAGPTGSDTVSATASISASGEQGAVAGTQTGTVRAAAGGTSVNTAIAAGLGAAITGSQSATDSGVAVFTR
jgi:hypothetical protein